MVERDPERGRAAAARLKALGVRESSSRQPSRGYITQLACKMPECFCPEELGGACYFEPVTDGATGCRPTSTSRAPRERAGTETGTTPSWRTASATASILDQCWPSVREGSRLGQESSRGSDPPERNAVGRLNSFMSTGISSGSSVSSRRRLSVIASRQPAGTPVVRCRVEGRRVSHRSRPDGRTDQQADDETGDHASTDVSPVLMLRPRPSGRGAGRRSPQAGRA